MSSNEPSSAISRALAVAERLGIKVSPDTVAPGECPWDGEVLHGHVSATGLGSLDWWHEIGHFLVAPEEGHSLKGWGLGQVYDYSDGGPVLFDDAEEADASAVGIWCQLVLGNDEPGARIHAYEHSWTASRPWEERIIGARFDVQTRIAERLTSAGFKTPFDDETDEV